MLCCQVCVLFNSNGKASTRRTAQHKTVRHTTLRDSSAVGRVLCSRNFQGPRKSSSSTPPQPHRDQNCTLHRNCQPASSDVSWQSSAGWLCSSETAPRTGRTRVYFCFRQYCILSEAPRKTTRVHLLRRSQQHQINAWIGHCLSAETDKTGALFAKERRICQTKISSCTYKWILVYAGRILQHGADEIPALLASLKQHTNSLFELRNNLEHPTVM